MATVQKNSSVMKYKEINKEEEKGLDQEFSLWNTLCLGIVISSQNKF